jgi:hypothetical protein
MDAGIQLGAALLIIAVENLIDHRNHLLLLAAAQSAGG